MQDPVYLKVGNKRNSRQPSPSHYCFSLGLSYCTLFYKQGSCCWPGQSGAPGSRQSVPACASLSLLQGFFLLPDAWNSTSSSPPQLLFQLRPVVPGSSLETLKLLFIFSSTRSSEPTTLMSQAKPQRDGLGWDALSTGLVGCRRDKDAEESCDSFWSCIQSPVYAMHRHPA